MPSLVLPTRTTPVAPSNLIHAVAEKTSLRYALRDMRKHFTHFMQQLPQSERFRTKRYVYDLSALCRELALLLGRAPTDSISRAWVVEHLRSYHNLEVEDLTDYIERSDIRAVDELCPGWARVNTSTLYNMFRPMAFAATDALTSEMSFKNDILTVTLTGVGELCHTA